MDDSSQISSDIQRIQVLKTDYYCLFVFSAFLHKKLPRFVEGVLFILN